MHSNHTVRSPEHFHARSPQNPPPQKPRESRDWPLLVPAAVVAIGLIVLVLYISSQWQSLSVSFE
jgi:hypothetical protein